MARQQSDDHLDPVGPQPQAARRRGLGRPRRRRRGGHGAGRQGASRSSSTSPARRRSPPTAEIAAAYGNGGDVAPLVPVVTLPEGTTVDRPGVPADLEAALAKVKAALPAARIASYASTRDRTFVSADGRTTFALVSIPAKGGVDPGQAEARRAQAALDGVTVAGAPVQRDRPRRAARGRGRRRQGRRREHGRRGADRGRRRAARPRLRLRLVDGDRAAADGARRDPDDVPARLAAGERRRTSR